MGAEAISIHFSVAIAIRLIDLFRRTSIPHAKIQISGQSKGVFNKKNGFYVIEGLSKQEYKLHISCVGYEEKTIVLSSSDNAEITVVTLRPKQLFSSFTIEGTIEGKKRKAFYYTLCCDAFTKVVLENEMVNRLSIGKEDVSLEGEKFAFAKSERIYTFGKYRVLGERYEVVEKIEEKIYAGSKLYLLFQERTEETGRFQFWLPKDLVKDSHADFIFFIDGKSHKISVRLPLEKPIDMYE